MHHDSFDDGDASSEDGGFLDEFVDAERALGTASGSGGSEASTSGVFTSAFVNHKAGMDEVDKAHVRQVVHDMSKDSAHHRNEQVRETKVLSKIREMLEKKRKLSDDQLRRYQREVDVFVSALETKRDLSKTWIHVDMDAFYAAVHTLRNPEYATIPIAVGGIGMISTANYVARKFGVRSAMPGFIAKKLCPQLTFVNSDFTLYKHYAGLAREVFRTYDPEFDALSLDEAFLDVTGYLVVNKLTPEEAASKLRLEVFQKTGLTCSAGVAPTRRLAKILSDVNKPDGQMILRNDRGEILTYLHALPVRKVGGVGKVLERVLQAFGVVTVGDLWTERAAVHALFTTTTAEFLLQVSLGVGTELRPEKPEQGKVSRKSLGQEETFPATSDFQFMETKITELALEVARGLVTENLRARTVVVKIKQASFEVTQRQVSFEFATCVGEVLAQAALTLFRAETNAKNQQIKAVRLLGVKASGLEKNDEDTAGGVQTKVDAVLFREQGVLPVDGVSFTCHCSALVLETERHTHLDWHFARETLRLETEAETAKVPLFPTQIPPTLSCTMLAAIASRGHGVKRKKGKEVDKTQKTLFQAFGGKK